MKDYTLECTCTAAPVQYEGIVDGHGFYFRARYMAWSCSFSDTIDHAIGFCEITAEYYSRRDAFFTGEWGTGQYDASYMDADIAEKIIDACIALWRLAAFKGDS